MSEEKQIKERLSAIISYINSVQINRKNVSSKDTDVK